MKTKNNTDTKKKTELQMKKYIVEAPVPQEGQKISSGGVRENGKLTSQFKNPIPYTTPNLQPPKNDGLTNIDNLQKNQLKFFRNEICIYLLEIFWEEFGEEVFRFGLRKLREKIAPKLDNTISYHTNKKEEKERYSKYLTTNSNPLQGNNILQFSQKKVI